MTKKYPRLNSLKSLKRQTIINKKAREGLLAVCISTDPRKNSKQVLEAAIVLHDQTRRVERSVLDCVKFGVDKDHIMVTLKNVYQENEKE